jgi:hypothetical protein
MKIRGHSTKDRSWRYPDTVHIGSRDEGAPRVEQTQAVKARLDPLLNKPYFEIARGSMNCTHSQYGILLDKTTQRAYCLNCKQEIALFDALWNYHQAEQRLVHHLQSLDEHDKREAEKKKRDKERRPFMRKVTDTKAVRDMSLKAEPVVAQIYTLECGHERKMDGDRRFEKVHCSACQMKANTVVGGKPASGTGTK